MIFLWGLELELWSLFYLFEWICNLGTVLLVGLQLDGLFLLVCFGNLFVLIQVESRFHWPTRLSSGTLSSLLSSDLSGSVGSVSRYSSRNSKSVVGSASGVDLSMV